MCFGFAARLSASSNAELDSKKLTLPELFGFPKLSVLLRFLVLPSFSVSSQSLIWKVFYSL